MMATHVNAVQSTGSLSRQRVERLSLASPASPQRLNATARSRPMFSGVRLPGGRDAAALPATP